MYRLLPEPFRSKPIFHRIGFPGVSFLMRPHFHLGSSKSVQVSADELSAITDNFNAKNLIGQTQFGQLYHGKILENWDPIQTRQVMVKIWDSSPRSPGCICYKEAVAEEKTVSYTSKCERASKFVEVDWILPRLSYTKAQFMTLNRWMLSIT